MVSYFLDDRPDKRGLRMVRSAFCPDLPDYYSRIYLGEFDSIEEAHRKAVLYHTKIHDCMGCRVSSAARITYAGAGLVE